MADLLNTVAHSSLAHSGRKSLRHWLGGKALTEATDVLSEVQTAIAECAANGWELTLPSKEGANRAVIALSAPLTVSGKLAITAEGNSPRMATYYPEFRYIGTDYVAHAVKFDGGGCNLTGFNVNGNGKTLDALVLENFARGDLLRVTAEGSVRHAIWISAPGSSNCDSISLTNCGGKICGRGHCCSTEGTAYEIVDEQLWQSAVTMRNHPTVVATVGEPDGDDDNLVTFTGLNFTPTLAQLGDANAIPIFPGDHVVLLVDGVPEFHHFSDTAPASATTISLNGVAAKQGNSYPAVICSGSALAIGPANDANLIRVTGGAYRLCGGPGVNGLGFYGSYFEQVEVTETFGPGYNLGWRSSEGRNLGGTALINPYVGDGLFLGGVGPWLYSCYAPAVNVTGGILYSGDHMAHLAYPAHYLTIARGGAWKGHEILALYDNVPE